VIESRGEGFRLQLHRLHGCIIVGHLARTFQYGYVLAMTSSPEWSSLLELYRQTVCTGVLQYLEKQTGVRSRRGV
jgi:hypothetical protein